MHGSGRGDQRGHSFLPEEFLILRDHSSSLKEGERCVAPMKLLLFGRVNMAEHWLFCTIQPEEFHDSPPVL